MDRLWPYSKRAALVAIPIIWIAGFLVMFALSKYPGWLDFADIKTVLPVLGFLGFVPLVLVLIDFAASRRAVLDIKGVKIDFSQQAADTPWMGLPDNIGIPGALVTDSSPMQIVEALAVATQSEVAVVDLRDGSAWWVTRLLALCAGAVRSGRPTAIVFVGMKESVSESFLGWAEPIALLRAISADKPEYESTYRYAESITAQLVAFRGTELLPTVYIAPTQQILALHMDVNRYALQIEYVNRGAAAFEQILMDQLALKYENPPDRLTLGRLNHLFEHCLYRDVVNLAESGEKQVLALLRARGQFIGLMKMDRFVGLLKAETGQRAALQQLFTERPSVP